MGNNYYFYCSCIRWETITAFVYWAYFQKSGVALPEGFWKGKKKTFFTDGRTELGDGPTAMHGLVKDTSIMAVPQLTHSRANYEYEAIPQQST